MLNILVIDDDENDGKRLVQSLHQAIGGKLIYNLSCFQNCDSIDFETQRYDIYFLDIDMPDQDGIRVARKIREWDYEAIVIFVTYHDNLVFESLEVNPFQFVRKGCFGDDFKRCTDLLLKRVQERSLFYSFQFNGDITTIRYRDIIYFEKRKNDLYIFAVDEVFRNRDNLSYVEAAIKHPNFIRIHHSYLVNMEYIKLLNDHIELRNGVQLPVSRSKAKEVKEKYLMYLKRKL